MEKIKLFFKMVGGFIIAGILGIFYLLARKESKRNDNRGNIDGIGEQLDSEGKRLERERTSLTDESGEIDSERADIDRERESIEGETGILERDKKLIRELKRRNKK